MFRTQLYLHFLVIGIIFAQNQLPQINLGEKKQPHSGIEKKIETYEKKLEAEPDNQALQYDLGTLHMQNIVNDEALEYLSKASLGENEEIREKAWFNIGNVQFKAQKLEEAIAAYKKVLRLNANNQLARENLEFLYTLLRQQEQQKNEQNKQQEPSEYAKQLKKEAEKLVANRQYKLAYQLMMNGMKKDPTVQAFADFIQRINDVATIDG
jgi:tetratricopeptide (TPR) repeat protein